ncbi:hypothetical protein ACMD2_12737 [Ananas comosus]|uniref:Uncharacterized protein n=1 Tax=Ananas comosus TaxID=4615 RepID=A0A199W3R8_ANACO|nr:hypothetical protein ACMD2_12737 [Ananas comosus]
MFAIRAFLLRCLLPPLPQNLISSLNPNPTVSSLLRTFSSSSGGKEGDKDGDWGGSDEPRSGGEVLPGFDWGEASSWSMGLTKDHFNGAAVGRQVAPGSAPPPPPTTSAEMTEARAMDEEEEILRMLEKDNKESKAFVDGWGDRTMETYQLLK